MMSNSLFVLISWVSLASCVPELFLTDFAWAENLLITNDGQNMFISEHTRGELYRASLCGSGDEYCRYTHLSDSVFDEFGGLAQTSDGRVIYAGATFKDGSHGVVATFSNASKVDEYTLVTTTQYQPNGMQIDWAHGMLYYTDVKSGSLMGVNINDATAADSLAAEVKDANGCWLDANAKLLYVGELMSKHVNVFDVSVSPLTLLKRYEGLSSLSMQHMLDDLTLLSTSNTENMEDTVVLGGDYGGHEIAQFSLDGESIGSIPVPEAVLATGDLNSITSIRFGKGPHFDEDSIYVSEGGGMTARNKDRRVFQVKMK